MTRVIQRSPEPEPEAKASPVALAPGTRLGRYELLCPIAEGGMAQVWAAEQAGDLGFRKLIALKTIRPDYAHDASFRAMFLDEAQLASRIRHVNVVEVLDLGVDGDIVYQAMALIEGTSLSEWGRSHRLPVGVATRIAIDMLRGLHAAHDLRDDDGNELGLVHRDVSPQNVLVGTDGVAKLADFGIAKAFGRATEETIAGDVKGKIGYVAPEQLEGFPAAPQSDLFSAGVVFWELLTTERLFQLPPGAGSSDREGKTIKDPRSINMDVPSSIAKIAMRALLENPFDRYETSLEMADALEEAVRSEDLAATHRDVATQLERDMGPVIADRREDLRQAKKRAGFAATPNPVSQMAVGATAMISAGLTSGTAPTMIALEPTTVPNAPEPVALEPTTVPNAPDAPPAARVVNDMTDSVAVAEPQLRYAPTGDPPRQPRDFTLPLIAGVAVVLALVIAVAASTRGEPPNPTLAASPKTHVAAPVPVVESAAPVVAVPIAVPAEPPVAAPVELSSSAPASHRPILPHGRVRPPTKPAAASPSPSSAAPRFENPY